MTTASHVDIAPATLRYRAQVSESATAPRTRASPTSRRPCTPRDSPSLADGGVHPDRALMRTMARSCRQHSEVSGDRWGFLSRALTRSPARGGVPAFLTGPDGV